MLTDTRIRQLRPNGKVQKVSDGGGLYVQVAPTGTKSWRMGYRFEGRQKTLTIGQYPDVSLADARLAREQARKLLAQGVDPAAKKQEEKSVGKGDEADGRTFEMTAMEWYERKRVEFAPSHARDVLLRLRKHLFPFIGSIPIAELRPRDILRAARAVEETGCLYTARLIASMAARVCAYAQVCEYTDINAGAGLTSVLTMPVEKHRAAVVKPDEFGKVLASLDDYAGHHSVRYALKLLPYVFLRSSELRRGRWEEVDFASATWTIPPERMKMRREHVVPLARQVVGLLHELRELDNGGELMFPSPNSRSQPISDMGLLVALRRLGYSREEICVHGFRSSASTMLNAMGKFSPDIIEAQLAHADKDKVRAAYNRNDYLEQRREMMQEWADYVDDLRDRAMKGAVR
ncbi:MAG: integrase arm-type DNA-binding domain-containing protein [Desulfovibrio sp.]|nr:integrase arm-type DNA-binding domain-containing protein [Desulfovibrio sp.]